MAESHKRSDAAFEMAESNTTSTNYILDRDIVGSVRLDAQHLLWRLHLNYLIHPSVPVPENARIAELGCGTAIWLLDLSAQVPPTVQLEGFDLSGRQFPHQKLWPDNIKLSELDSLGELPPSLEQQFDLVHLRMWASNINPESASIVVRNAYKMLKPGGFLQWEEADILRQVVQGDGAIALETKLLDLYETTPGLDFSWIAALPATLRREGFEVIQAKTEVFEPHLVQLASNTYLLALVEVLKGIRVRRGQDQETDHSCEQLLAKLSSENTSGFIYNWGPDSLLAQRPG